MIRQRFTAISLEGWYYLVVMGFILAGALLREINLLIVLFGLMAGPMLLNWRMVVVSLGGLEFRRHLPEGTLAGDLFVVEIEAHNTRRRGASWAVVVEDLVRRAGAAEGAAAEPKILFSYLAPGASRKLSYQGRLPRRGRYTFGPLTVSTRFPLGLVRRTLVLDQPDTLLVYPRLGRLSHAWFRRHGEASQGSQRMVHRQGLTEGDYHGLRDYRSGDSRRWIHWRTSARRGELMVRQFEQQRNQDLCLLVDLWQPEQPGEPDLENVELAVSFAATIVSDRCRRAGSYLVIGIASDAVRFHRGPASHALLQEAMKSLAVVEADGGDHLPQLLSEALDSVRPGTNIVLLSTRPTSLDAPRFAKVWSDPRKKAWSGKALMVDTSSQQLTTYFQAE